ncbi:MAG TPA: peptidoglycan-binding domain-containing protein, partial [Candidatus Dormibacteraeota bacterium]
ALRSATSPPAVPQAATTGLARVTRTDLVTTQPVAGTIGYGGTSTLVAPATSTQQALGQAQAAVTNAVNKVAADQTAASDSRTIDQLALSADQATLASDQQRRQADCAASATSAECATDQQKVATDQAKVAQDHAQGQQHADQARATMTADQATLTQAQQQLVQAQAIAGSPGNFYTGVAGPGSVVVQGHPLYWIDGRPVPLLYGTMPVFRALRQGLSGADVQQLERDLISLGYATSANLATDGSFTGADAAAVKRWQTTLGVPQTGVVNLGDLAFLPGPIRVTALHAAAGGVAQGGQPVLDYTSTTRVVSVALTPSLSSQVKAGDAVTVDLPGGHTRLPGKVADVSTVATQQQQGGGAQAQAQTQNGVPQATIGVTITFDDPSQVSALDQAPVTVDVTTQSAQGVLTVPVNALLALAGGGYGVEAMEPNGRHRLLPVQTGIFDNSQVQVSGAGLSEGMNVVVPSS